MDNLHSSTIGVYVRHEPSKTDRQVTLPSGSKLAALTKEVHLCFNDLIPHTDEGSLYWQWFHAKKHEYVELLETLVLKDKDKVKFSVLSATMIGPVIPHPIDDSVPYYIWSLTSWQNDCLLKKSSPASIKLLCNGNYTDYTDKSNLVRFTARDVSSTKESLFAFILKPCEHGQAKKSYAIKGQSENADVIVQELASDYDKTKPPTVPNDCKFEFQQNFSYTQLRWNDVDGQRTDLYLNASKDGSVKLTKAGLPGYPNPNTLFIVRTDT